MELRGSVGFVEIGRICVSFIENEVTIDGRYVYFFPRELQALRRLALWYPDVAPYEQIYYNLPFCVCESYASTGKMPEMKRCSTRLVGDVQTRLESIADGICITSSYGKGYKLVCRPKRQACPNESSVQDTLHSQSTGSFS